MASPFDVKNVPPGATLELYISPDCPYCAQAMEHYRRTGVPFVVHDAQNGRRARDRMFGYTGDDRTVPAIVIDGTYVQSGWGTPPRG